MPEENLKPEDKRTEQTLHRAHQAAAWAMYAATTASFFNRASLLWIRHMRDRIPAADVRLHQDLNKLTAAVQFSADATLNATRFAARSISLTVTTHRLIWLHQWQADAQHKWCLASAPFKGELLFEDNLDPFLIETKDKRKILPSINRRGSFCPVPYFNQSSFQGSSSG